MIQERTYRTAFNKERFKGFTVQHLETDLWVGIDPGSYHKEMDRFLLNKMIQLRQKMDNYISNEPQFQLSLKPFQPNHKAPIEARDMAKAAARAGVGPMASVAGLFSREAGEALLENFSAKELVIENGGDIYTSIEQKLVLTVYAGSSSLSEKIGFVIPAGFGKAGICTSAGTFGPSLSFGLADAVAVVCKDILLADALATALGNMVKSARDIEHVLKFSENYPEILSVVIICEEKVGMRGELEIVLI